MNNKNDNLPAGRNWQTYASLELHPGEVAGEMLESWLNEALRPLALPAELLRKVHASALDAVVCFPVHVRLLHWVIFTPAPQPPDDQTWGFFRVIKNGAMPDPQLGSTYEIVFYLYAEGAARPG